MVRGVNLRGTTLLPPAVSGGRSLASNKAVAGNGAGRPALRKFRRAAQGPVSTCLPAPVRTNHRFSERDGSCLLPIIAFKDVIATILAQPSGFVKGQLGAVDKVPVHLLRAEERQ